MGAKVERSTCESQISDACKGPNLSISMRPDEAKSHLIALEMSACTLFTVEAKFAKSSGGKKDE